MNVSVRDLQDYLYHHYGEWGNENGLFMKLVEELGEVAEVLNKRSGRKASDDQDLQDQLGAELADMIHYIVAIAAINHIDLNDIILQKDKAASVKYHHDTNLETFISQKETKCP